MKKHEVEYDPETGIVTISGTALKRARRLSKLNKVPLDLLVRRAMRIGLDAGKWNPDLLKGEK